MARVLQASAASLLAAAVFVSIVGASGDAPLTQAVKTGDLAAVRTLVASGADVDVRSGDGSTPLLWATQRADVAAARALVAAGATVDAANEFGITPLLHASRMGDSAMVDVLLQAGADPRLRHPDGATPLMLAARSGSVATAKLLLARGADVDAIDSYQSASALMWAAAEGHVDMARILLESGADPDVQAHVNPLTERHNADFPTGGFTALMFAARSGNAELARVLVEGGADTSLVNGDGASATMIAIYNDQFDLAAKLIEMGADANDGSLYMAVQMRDATTDQFAFDGSRLRPDNPNERTALDLIGFLLDHGADPNKNFKGQMHSWSMPNSDNFDNTPLYKAAIAADVEALKVLIAHGANLEQTPLVPEPEPEAEKADDADAPPPGRGRGNPNAGKTPVMAAMTGGRAPAMTGGPAYIREGEAPYREPGARNAEEAFTLLIASGANPNAKDADGLPLLHQVTRVGNLAMIRALADAGVDFTQTNAEGQTALQVAEAPAPAGRGGRRGGGPGFGGRGGGRGASRQEVAALLRELMGLPPAPAAEATTGDDAQPEADAAAETGAQE